MKKVFLVLLVGGMLVSFGSCKQKTSAEKAKDAIEQTGKDLEKGIKKTGKEMEKAAKKAEKDAKKATK
ncbi:hypothetical protein [Paludibacter sp. 221]|uniref:hypothetical protein n=1 Tax=Paludibacter sp. 221 TaxID=2302939 RepID=UPI0013D6D6A1|nr:hypothetical protein [Paludibacter sp. 221]